MIRRLLADAKNTAVTDAMAEALLEQRGQQGVATILQVLGSPVCEEQEDTAFHLSMRLLQAWTKDLDVGATLEQFIELPDARPELLGALEFVGWASRDHPPTSRSFARVRELTESSELRVREAALYALEDIRRGRLRIHRTDIS